MNILRNSLKVIVSSCLILLQVSCTLGKSQTRIVGGEPTTIAHAPYLVQIYRNGNFACGGSLLSEDFVLSAAHCFDGHDPSHFLIVGGASKRRDAGIRSRVNKFIIPKEYSLQTFNNDVAVVKLSTPIKGASVRPAKLCSKPVKRGDIVKLFGWGLQRENSKVVPLQVHTVDVKVMDEAACQSLYRKQMLLTDSMFCAAAPGKDACTGDSGGPAVVDGEVCGIVSWGIGCGRRDSPGVYTNVLKEKSFINKAMKLLI